MPAPTYREQFEIANGFASTIPSLTLPDHPQPVAPPQPDVPAQQPAVQYRPIRGVHQGNGWDKLKPYAQAGATRLQQQFPGLTFTSGGRDPEHNRKVGGVPNSKHIPGEATDFVGSAREMYDAAAWAKRNGAKHVLVHNAGSGQHLHVEW